ncbi:MAG: hypothetical protein LBD80_04625 [Tannerella sp.]|jgi:hypothetical protein|nr:hypothetical protein [Tannerella sp.]
MKNNSAELDKLMARKPFRVPEGYFENFTEKMIGQLPEKQIHPKGEKVRLFERVRSWFAVAAVFIGFVTVFFTHKKKTDNMRGDKDMIVKNISSRTVSKLDKDSYSKTDFFDYLAEEYSNDNAEEFIDNLTY